MTDWLLNAVRTRASCPGAGSTQVDYHARACGLQDARDYATACFEVLYALRQDNDAEGRLADELCRRAEDLAEALKDACTRLREDPPGPYIPVDCRATRERAHA